MLIPKPNPPSHVTYVANMSQVGYVFLSGCNHFLLFAVKSYLIKKNLDGNSKGIPKYN